eukprot:COSAG03_NODE_1858_length_3423_cov_7.658544_4_plen_72_part_00
MRNDAMVAPALFLILAATGAAAGALPPAPPGYELIPELSDEFDGDTLDPAKWQRRCGRRGGSWYMAGCTQI